MSTAPGAPLDWKGREYASIQDHDRLTPFLLAVVSSTDAWMFLSSLGAPAAGRRSPASSLFPYQTDDRLHDAAGVMGPYTAVRVTRGESTALWRPLDPRGRESFRLERRLMKTTHCEAVMFEERNLDLGLTFRASWEASQRFGWIRRVELVNEGELADVEVLDGLLGIMPADADRSMQTALSTLLDAYRLAEMAPEGGLGLFRLSSIPIDQPRPNESLRATTVFCIGLDGPTLLSAAQIGAFETDGQVEAEPIVRGGRCAYLRGSRFQLAEGAREQWLMAADVEQDGAAVVELMEALRDPGALEESIAKDQARCREALIHLVASADGLQRTGNQREDARHYANTLFNIMRGGVLLNGGRFDADGFSRHVSRVAPAIAAAESELLGELQGELDRDALLAAIGGRSSEGLLRLAREYLPLTFGRRHGDPSRPWNSFTIPAREPSGARPLHYEGNWRDIFQNWEALTLSFPGFADACVSRFLNASTADGYNPYRIDMHGVDWEVDDPDDPWAFIGYWGDHQVVYLLRLVEMVERFTPGGLGARLKEPGYVFVDVPYRIDDFEGILADPHSTVRFDDALAAKIDERVSSKGNEGRLLHGPDGGLVTANLAEKLLTPLLVKLTNLVPGGGVWMNTQRPEWNDANNAIAGLGLSVVTTAYLHSALEAWTRIFSGEQGALQMTAPVAELIESLRAILVATPPDDDLDPAGRLELTERLGRAGERHRRAVYAGRGAEACRDVPSPAIVELLQAARRWTGATLASNVRPDGLYHSYNLMQRTEGGIAIRRLALMLEGQVAVLAAGLLDSERTIALLHALRASDLYRADERSYLLYPDRDVGAFLGRGAIGAQTVAASPAMKALLARGGGGVLVRAVDGSVRFHSDLHHRDDLQRALEASGVPTEVHRELHAVYEEVFDHEAFPGRSMTFFGYEGLGCIYWHMISKLILAAQNAVWSATDEHREQLIELYGELRAGLGTHKSPDEYGAFPSDPYSHTPARGGARQPGLTGQVKEDVLGRLGECGVHVAESRLGFRGDLSRFVDPVEEPTEFRYFDAAGAPRSMTVPAGTAVFTYCCVPVLLRRSDAPRLRLSLASGAVHEVEGSELDERLSREIFRRTGRVKVIEAWT
ncbi:MAG: hypothetical protein VX015_03165 [Planctomycetota bacterium]|nr:hypothetical protein [Planctomycetota bacterium]